MSKRRLTVIIVGLVILLALITRMVVAGSGGAGAVAIDTTGANAEPTVTPEATSSLTQATLRTPAARPLLVLSPNGARPGCSIGVWGRGFPSGATINGLAIWVQYQLRGAPNFNIVHNREISRRVFEEHLEDSPLPARIYALMHATYQDAWITTQDTKFTYWTARPNMFDPSITTLFPNPPHPSYVSNGSALATPPALILGHFFPRDAAALKKQADEYGDARLWAGIHFPSDVEVSRPWANNSRRLPSRATEAERCWTRLPVRARRPVGRRCRPDWAWPTPGSSTGCCGSPAPPSSSATARSAS